MASGRRGWLRLLDYQFPLKASRSDTGLGEVDLLGATDRGCLVVTELKVRRKDGPRGDTPLLALMERLRYAAVVHANHRAIAAEAREHFAIHVSVEPPIVQILASEDWWRGWCDMACSTRLAAGQWEPKFLELSAQLEARLGIVIECASLQGISLADASWDGRGPRLGQTPPVSAQTFRDVATADLGGATASSDYCASCRFGVSGEEQPPIPITKAIQ